MKDLRLTKTLYVQDSKMILVHLYLVKIQRACWSNTCESNKEEKLGQLTIKCMCREGLSEYYAITLP